MIDRKYCERCAAKISFDCRFCDRCMKSTDERWIGNYVKIRKREQPEPRP